MAPKFPSSVTWSRTTTSASPEPAAVMTSARLAYSNGRVRTMMPWWAPWLDAASRTALGTRSHSTPQPSRRLTSFSSVGSSSPEVFATSAFLSGTLASSASATARRPSMTSPDGLASRCLSRVPSARWGRPCAPGPRRSRSWSRPPRWPSLPRWSRLRPDGWFLAMRRAYALRRRAPLAVSSTTRPRPATASRMASAVPQSLAFLAACRASRSAEAASLAEPPA